MQVEILRVEKTSVKSSTDRSRSLVDETPPHLAWSESLLQLVVVPEIEIWTYTGAPVQLRWPKTASTGRYRLNRKWKYGLAIFVVLSIVNRLTKTGHRYLNWPPKYCNANMVPHCKIIAHLKTFNVRYSKILTATPCFLYLFTQPTGMPIFLQKLTNRKCLFFKLIAPKTAGIGPFCTMSQFWQFEMGTF